MARERGLEGLSDAILAQGQETPETIAAAFVDPEKEVPDVEAALAGARDIVAELVAEHADLRAFARDHLSQHGVLHSLMHPNAEGQRTKYEQYYDYSEPRSEEHTSELQSRGHLVCRLLLETK